MEEKATSSLPVRLNILGEKGETLHSSDYAKEKIVIGRILSADLRIDDPRVSRIHALIEVKENGLNLTDLASSHGTFVNGKRIVETPIKLGDVIKIGVIEIKIEKGVAPATGSQKSAFEGAPVLDTDATQMDIDRSVVDSVNRRGPDRRKSNAFPEEKRLDDRRKGERRIEQRSGEERRVEADEKAPPKLPEGVESDRRHADDRRHELEYERRVGERRRGERRVFDITSLERRISERRTRGSDDDLLPEELENAFEAPEHARELEVTALWGDHILDVSNYFDPVVLTVGESPTNEYIIPSVGIPDEFPLITIEEDGTAFLAFTAKMKGTVRARDQIYSIPDLIKAKFTRKIANYYVVSLKQDDFAKLSIGTVNFFILYVKPAPRVLPAPLFDRDALLMRTFIGSVLLLALLFLIVSLVPKAKPVTIEMIPERFAKIVIKKRPKIPDAIKADQTQKGGSVKGEGAKAKNDEGKAGAVDKPKEKQAQKITPKKKTQTADAQPKPKPKKVERQRKVVDAEKAKSVGLLKAFNKSNLKQNVKSLTDTSAGGFDDFGKAVEGMRAKSLDRAGGAGGKGIKGVSAGGGGKTIGIDGPSTQGVGRGDSGGGIGEGIGGPGRLGVKGEHAVNIVSENVQVLSGLPKDVINAVVNRHKAEIRACYDAALQRNPSVRGKVVIAFNIQPNGIVSSSTVKSSSVGDQRMGDCIAARVKSWVFPKPEAPVVTEVSAYPFYLNPAN